VSGDAPAKPSPETAGAHDLDALVALERACASHPWTRAHFDAALRSPGTRVTVLRGAAGEPALVALCVVARAADEVEIHDVAVHPVARRRGFARRLLTQALAEAARAGARTAFLDVRASNRAARALYAGLGFAPAGRRRGYYRAPEEDALVLRLELRSLEFTQAAC
jgi:ribosomal-protein-alanine N-acetyltransferase